VTVDRLDMIQSGRQDLALALGVPGQPDHPNVLEARSGLSMRRIGPASGCPSTFLPHLSRSTGPADGQSEVSSASQSAGMFRSYSMRCVNASAR
jgi:hypothetical protein